MFQWRDTETAAAEYSQLMRCRGNRHPSLAEVAAKSPDNDGFTCTNVDTLRSFGQRFSSPARTAFHAAEMTTTAAG